MNDEKANLEVNPPVQYQIAIHTLISGRGKLLTSNNIDTCVELGTGIS